MATSTYGTPYVQGSDLVSAYPTVSSNLATRVDEVSYRGNGLNAQTGTTYTLVAGDAGKTITLSNASAVAVTLPQDSVATLPTGAVVSFYNLGAGTVTISQGTGATLQGGSLTLPQYAVTSVIKLSANTYGKFDGGESAGTTLVTPTSTANTGGSVSLTGGALTFTTVTSLSLNGIFTSTYDTYMLTIDCTGSANNAVAARLRVGGTDNTGATSYIQQYFYASGTTTGAARTTTSSWIDFMAVQTATRVQLVAYLFSPAIARQTGLQTSTQYGTSGAAFQQIVGTHDQSVAYDGLTIFPASGSITGTIRCYGLKN